MNHKTIKPCVRNSPSEFKFEFTPNLNFARGQYSSVQFSSVQFMDIQCNSGVNNENVPLAWVLGPGHSGFCGSSEVSCSTRRPSTSQEPPRAPRPDKRPKASVDARLRSLLHHVLYHVLHPQCEAQGRLQPSLAHGSYSCCLPSRRAAARSRCAGGAGRLADTCPRVRLAGDSAAR